MRLRHRSMLTAGLVVSGIAFATIAASPAAFAADDTDAPVATCAIDYATNGWENGATTSVTIYNNGDTPIKGWQLMYLLPSDQKITDAWNASIQQDYAILTATNLSYNATIASGESVNFGYNVSFTSNDGTTPSEFALNGEACSIIGPDDGTTIDDGTNVDDGTDVDDGTGDGTDITGGTVDESGIGDGTDDGTIIITLP